MGRGGGGGKKKKGAKMVNPNCINKIEYLHIYNMSQSRESSSSHNLSGGTSYSL